MISITTIQIWYIHSDVVISANKKGGVMYVALPFFSCAYEMAGNNKERKG